jgi:hypothetical protein
LLAFFFSLILFFFLSPKTTPPPPPPSSPHLSLARTRALVLSFSLSLLYFIALCSLGSACRSSGMWEGKWTALSAVAVAVVGWAL